ncbi:transcription initiation factor IIF [Lojkania enalia]|uniref:Transcription initiation factor IIF subunit beta n=1 Tax=Lojkania enalia TaxID=147567 RepID=A0A9P4NCJ9_9PLEO|nr:transcription initiation factor IIF [Didymosphaeria enalia]
MNGIKPDPDIKMDPDAMTPPGSGYMDDDFYEDTGELQLPDKNAQKDIWLTRIPRWLYDAVANYDDLADGNDDDQIVIGEVQFFPDPDRPGGVSKTRPMRMFFNDKWYDKSKLPRAFQLQMSQASSDMLANTYVFTEKDLPGYKPTGLGQGRQGVSGNFGIQDPKARVQKRSKYKKAIPKQTSLLGSATREYTATPLPTKEYIEFEKQRTSLAIQGANNRTNIVDHMNDHIANMNVQKLFKTFIKPAVTTKPQINKAARIPKNELIDMLHQCFDEYAYWPMKSLKAKTQQPEAYLKEVLTDIADLVKTGPFASCWKRSAMYNRNAANQVEDKPPGADDVDDPDEEMEMEDVV